MKKILLLAATFSILSGPVFSENICKKACDQFIVCTEEIHQRKTTPQEEALGRKGCMDSCKKNYQTIKSCYLKMKKSNSCKIYSDCIMSAAQKKQ